MSTTSSEEFAPGVEGASAAIPVRIGCRLTDIGLVIVAIALLVALAASRYLRYVGADALLPALMSTQRLTFFYWSQNRLANVLPALAWPVRDAIWNFRLQMFVMGSAFFALLSMFVWFHLHASGRRASGARVAAGTAVAGLLVLGTMRAQTSYTFIFEQVYALSVVCLLAGGRVVMSQSEPRQPARIAIGAGMILVAVLLNPSVVLLGAAFWLLDDEPTGRRRRFVRAMAILIAAFLAGVVASRVFYNGSAASAYYGFSLARWRRGLDHTVSGILSSVDLSAVAIVGLGCAAVIAWRWRSLSQRGRLAYLGAPMTGVIWVIGFNGNEWVERSSFTYRYFFPLYAAGMVVVCGAIAELVAIAAASVERRAGWRSPGSPVVAAASVAAAMFSVVIAIASMSRATVPVLDDADDDLALAKRFDVLVVTGDYWSTWPIVVAARGAGLDLFGLTVRSEPIFGQISNAVDEELARSGSVRVLCTTGDASACTAGVTAVTGRTWRADLLTSDGPLVLELHAVP